jgi:hypothetical protein
MLKELLTPSQEVVIKLSCLSQYNLTPDLYTLMHWKYHDYELPSFYKDYIFGDSHALEYLQENGFIKIIGEGEFSLRKKATDLFLTDSPDEKWLEFLGKYPMKGGTRVLKIANPNSKGNIKVKKKYLSIINSDPNLHEHIIKVLEAEMKMRVKDNSMQYMQGMEVWLNQASYDKYAHLVEDSKSDDYLNEDYM